MVHSMTGNYVFMTVLAVVSIAVMKYHDQKQAGGEKGLFGLHVHLAAHH